MAKSKATKKFEKNKLQKVLEQRNSVKKINQKKHTAKKRKTEDQEFFKGDEAGEDAPEKKKKPKTASATDGDLFENMSVEQFFQGGFEVPAKPEKPKKKKEKNAKRKRDAIEETEDGVEGNDAVDENEEEDAIESHKDQLAALAEKDPEFFKFLKENDSELLDFKMAEEDDLSAISDLEDEVDEEEEEDLKKGKKGKIDDGRSKVVKKSQLETWEKSLKEQKSLRATREVVLAFRAAAHVGETEDKNFKYSIANPDVYHDLLVLALKQIPEVLNHHLPVKELPNGRIRISTDSAKFKTLTTLLKSHSASLLHLLTNLTDSSTTRLVLSSALNILPYLLSFRRFLRDFVKQVVEIWSSPSTEDTARVTAFLVLRRIVVIGDHTLQEACLKASYNGLLKGCRNTTPHTLPGINLMKNGGVDLFGVDEELSYMLGFGYIRQLAVHLRNSITNNSKESYKQVYNWQYLHSLDFWSRVLATHCDGLKQAEKGKQSPLHPLIYPLVQVTLGAARLIPTAQYFPLRLHLIRSLIRLSRHSGVYIPLASIILEMLSSNELKKAPKASTLKPLDFSTIIRVAKSYLRTRILQDGLGDQIVEVLSEYFVLWATSVAFPELVVPPIVVIRKYLKKASAPGGNKNVRFNNALALLVTKLEANSKWIEDKRRDVNFGPGRMDEVMGFSKKLEWEKSPLGVYVVTQRNVREEKRKMLEEAREAEQNKKDKAKDKETKKSKKAGKAKPQAEENSDEDMSDGFEDDDQDESLQFDSDDDDESDE